MPDTLSYLILGMGTAFGLLGFFILSVYIRFLNARKDLILVKQLQED